jgi:hypothetical protein
MTTLNEIKQQINSAKALYPALNEMNSTSKVSVWGLIRDTIAYCIWLLYTYFDSFGKEVEERSKTGYFGTLPWWIDKAKEFQYGDTLEWIDYVYRYAAINPELQIVKQVAINPVDRVLEVRAAKEVDGALTALEPDEKTGFEAYMNEIKFPGVFITVISQPADLLVLDFKVYYNGMVEKSAIETSIKEKVTKYLNSVLFNGVFNICECIDVIQELAGVKSVFFIAGSGRGYNVSLADAEAITESYKAYSGYMNIEELNLTLIAV